MLSILSGFFDSDPERTTAPVAPWLRYVVRIPSIDPESDKSHFQKFERRTGLPVIGPRGRRIFVLLHEDARPISLQIIELTAFGGPDESPDREQAEHYHARNQTVNDFHGTTSGCARHW
ncbi:MAG: hypothetical protein BECKG1743D_GA0114223_103633 [Candidatus Kentron sp. G]|nr:MAG: hypothetical protein BECKG1743F_GA0114225_103182 [Candidatus Kentron sp. G]VFN00957.1 MAG: hypothetical protein BECKG1743E_GA0114224_103662 [Candidatus Kentron sp. G]VFN02425.1 MAG: hypothetical protein BECKG1743D_GA0114223_103633 [Candidatus Kentron sp. G]